MQLDGLPGELNEPPDESQLEGAGASDYRDTSDITFGERSLASATTGRREREPTASRGDASRFAGKAADRQDTIEELWRTWRRIQGEDRNGCDHPSAGG